MQMSFPGIRRHCVYVLVISAMAFLSSYAPRAWAENRKYLQITDQAHTQFNWRIEKQTDTTAALTVTNTRNETAYTSKNNSLLEVTQWHLKNPSAKTELSAERQKNSIVINGTFKGGPFTKTLAIDDDPWFQPMSFSLTVFVGSKADLITFWTLNPDTLNAFKMKAAKVSVETLKINEKEIPAQKVKVSLLGIRSAFWHAYYWFSTKDGTFLKYEGVDGPPGTPLTITTLMDMEK